MAKSKKSISKVNTSKKSTKKSHNLPKLQGRSSNIKIVENIKVPRSFMRFSSVKSDELRVKGMEPLREIVTTHDVTPVVQLPFTVASPELFPRLSAIAGVFEEYRVHSVRLVYYPLCPSTTQGQLAMVLNHDPLESISNNIFSMAQFECSVVGTVTGKLSTPLWKPKDAQVYKTDPSNSSAPDLAMRSPGNLKVLSSGGSEESTAAGMVFMEYDITLTHPQPVAEESSPFIARTTQNTFSGAESQTANLCGFKDILSASGTGEQGSDSKQDPIVFGEQVNVNNEHLKSFVRNAQGLRTVINLAQNLGAATVSLEKLESDPFQGQGSGLSFEFTPGKGYKCLNPDRLKYLSTSNEKKVLNYVLEVNNVLSFSPEDCKGDPDLSSSWPKLPGVAGDISLYMVRLTTPGTFETQLMISYSFGTGSYNIRYGRTWLLPSSCDYVGVSIFPDGTEVRSTGGNVEDVISFVPYDVDG